MEGLENELHSFIESNCGEFAEGEDLDTSGLDEIVLSYVGNVVEELHNSHEDESSFDLDEFAELMKEYIPRFKTVDNKVIGNWVLELAKKMKEYKEHFLQEMEEYDQYNDDVSVPDTANSEANKSKSMKEQSPMIQNEEHSDPVEDNVLNIDESQHSEALRTLTDMFSNLCPMLLELHLATANDNLDSAIDLLLTTNNDDTTRHICTKACQRKTQDNCDVDDLSLKDLTMSRYGYVEVSAEEKTSNPTLNQVADRKLTRFRDNKVVSTRGEKFVDVKPVQSEDMKKTYVNLKPARKYRFH